MAQKLKLTGFTRFLIFMLFVVPIAYMGASYYNGEDGIQKIKDLANIDGDQSSSVNNNTSKKIGATELNDCIEALQRMEQQIKKLEAEVAELKGQN